MQRRHRIRRLRRTWGVALLSALVAAVAVTVAVFVIDRESPQSASSSEPATGGAVLDDQQAADAFRAGAASDIAAVTSYDYRTLDDALNTGIEVTTGHYRTSYRKALEGDLGAAAKRDRLVQTFDLLRTGIGTMSADGRTAKVLIFGNETVTSMSGKGTTRTRPTTLTATIVHRGNTYLIGDLEVGANAGLPPGSAELAVAAEAGRTQVVNLFSFRHDLFDADYARALAGSTEPLTSMIKKNVEDTRASLVKSRSDLVGSVTAVAVARADGDTVQFLVAASITRVGSDGTRSDASDGRFEVTVVRTGGQWLTSRVDQVDPD